ncbi:hypothetical protein OnM2_102011 [Erysiphe neolycopersici]|uniref:EF-hand domain-containing protein n=1 Tax=Erysiphe neolycopersici TaxID=212602 RepID=A0A420H8P1_9PEZI|nr:hypothetical protein OnM2_102011 [Erysiphe neolycopersici]
MVTSADKELFICNGCGETIGSERARIWCNICVDFNLCSNCYVIDYSSKTHRKSHATTVFRNSGHVNSENSNEILLSQSETHEGEQRKPSEETQRKYSEIPTANWGALWNVMKAPLAKKDKRSSKSIGKIETGALVETRHKSDLLSPFSGIPEPLPSLSAMVKPQQSPGYPGPKYFRPDKWEPFFESNNTPSSIFVGLMSSIFNTIDEKGTGFLKPEEFSGFLDIQGCPLSANIWKMACSKAAGASNKDVADLELGLYFSERSISHTLTARPIEVETNKGKSPVKVSSSDVKKKRSKNANQNMPLLSRQGFIDLCASEYLKDPSMAYQYLMNALHELRVWRELGDLPRSVLPSSPTSQDYRKDSNISTPNLDSKEMESLKCVHESHTVNENKEVIQKGIDENCTKLDFPYLNSTDMQSMSPLSIEKPEVASIDGDQKHHKSALEYPMTSKKESMSQSIIDKQEEKLIEMDVENSKSAIPHFNTSKSGHMRSPFDGSEEYSINDGSKENQKSPNHHLDSPEKDFVSPTFIDTSKVTLTREDSKDLKSTFQYPSTSEKEPMSTRFIVKFEDNAIESSDLRPKINPSLIKSTGPLQNKQKLVVKTDIPSQWLSTASAMSARSPRRKVEMLVEAFECVRANSICLDERPDFKNSPIYKNITT